MKLPLILDKCIEKCPQVLKELPKTIENFGLKIKLPTAMKAFATNTNSFVGTNPGSILLWTGTAGWTLSSAGQIFGIATNKEIGADQKKFLIPQEIADAVVNIGSFFLITRGCTKLAEKYVKNGTLSTQNIDKHLKRYGLFDKVGNENFNISQLKILNEQNPKFDRAFHKDYYNVADGVSFLASTAGSIMSCNIVTPLIRNKYGASQQKEALNKNEKEVNTAKKELTQKPVFNYQSNSMKI